MAFKPDGYPALSPYLIVEDARASHAFATKVFGAETLRIFADDQDSVRHSELRVGEGVVMIADGVADWPAVPGHLHIYVADVDATYALALASGAQSIQAPVKKDDADKRGGVRDPGGVTWWIATMVDQA